MDKIVYADGSPEITEITDLSSGFSDGSLSRGKPCRITGSRLKIGGNGSGVWFAPVDADGRTSTDESAWVKSDEASLFRNKPSELNFFVPDTLEKGSYRIVIRTAYLGKAKAERTLSKPKAM